MDWAGNHLGFSPQSNNKALSYDFFSFLFLCEPQKILEKRPWSGEEMMKILI